MFKYAIASFSLFPSPPTNGYTPFGYNYDIIFIMFAFILHVFLNSYFLTAGKNYSGSINIIPLTPKYFSKYFLDML